MDYHKHIIRENDPLNKALMMLDKLAVDAVLFTINDLGKLTGSLTDGDVRRGLMNGAKIDGSVHLVSFKTPKYLKEHHNKKCYRSVRLMKLCARCILIILKLIRLE